MSLHIRSILLGLIILSMAISSVAEARNNVTCGITPGQPLSNGYGPWDFTNPQHSNKLEIVLGAHFTRDVETLSKGASDTIEGDIDYTLRAIPNFHRALYAISKLEFNKRLALKKGKIYRPTHYSAECYFKRAIYMQPNDSITYMLYGMHLHKNKNYVDAKEKYLIAYSLSNSNPEINYNIGLLYIDMGDIVNAKKHAEIAYKHNYPLQGLKNKLAKLSKGSQVIQK